MKYLLTLWGDEARWVDRTPEETQASMKEWDAYTVEVKDAELVFVGYGISSPERNHDDYRADVTGKVVLALDHEPGERDENSPFDGVVTAQAADQLQ